jgi:hypothetical protein
LSFFSPKKISGTAGAKRAEESAAGERQMTTALIFARVVAELIYESLGGDDHCNDSKIVAIGQGAGLLLTCYTRSGSS